MRLTKQTSYALRILMYCAANGSPLSRVPEIAQAYNLSEPFLFKILKPLLKAGLVSSVRGRNGGIKLSKTPDQIRLYDVIIVTEDNFELADCFTGGANCPLLDSCALNNALNEALTAFFNVLKNYTIEDMAAPHSNIHALLGLEVDALSEVRK